jgi:DNA-binding SARP family transcriptional activator/Tfp pilus assembly protein PilF
MSSKVTYRQQFTRCGKPRCRKCREGAGHGPYWYAYWSEKGRTVSKYIGTHLPEDIEASQINSGEAEADTARASSHNPPAPVLRVYLLGQFRIERKVGSEWRTIDSRTWHRRRARALLGCLLSHAGRRLGREQLMELLWPDLDIEVAANRLNGAVHELRQILEPEIARPAASRMLRLERDVLELADDSQVWVDAEEFEHLLKAAETCTNPEQTEFLLDEAASLYRGSYLLEELYSEWAAPRRDALQREWVGLLLKLADLRAKRGAFVGAIELLDRLRAADPTNETALQRLMLLLTQLDRRGEALQVYRQHAATLKRDYESEPLPETVKLYDALRKGLIPAATTAPAQPAEAQEQQTTAPASQSDARQEQPDQAFPFVRPVFQRRHNQSPLIGRERELEAMRQVMLSLEGAAMAEGARHDEDTVLRALHTATSLRMNRPHFLLLRGEAGIGKTRLAEELSLEAYTRGWAVAWSRSYEQERAIPYRPWTEVLRVLLHGTATFSELVNSVTSANGHSASSSSSVKLERLSALLPELAIDATRPTMRSPAPLPHEQERLHLWEAALGLLGTLSKIHPLLLVFDDLHWADESSIELLTYLAHHLQDQRVLLLVTCREGELSPLHRLRTLITDLRREQAIVALSVQPLTHSQIGTLVAHLPEDIVESVQKQAAGNPFFAEELARYLEAMYSEEDLPLPIAVNRQTETAPGAYAARPDPARSSHTLPEAIAAVLERRLSRLSNDCQALLGKAAVLGGSFELSQLLPMVREHDEDTVLDLLEEALQAGLLTEEGTGAHITYHFWHPLIISHLYERLSAARRAQLHRRAAEAIKATHLAAPEKVAAAIVHHLSRGGGDPEQIACYAELAGNQAYSLAAYSEAQQYYLQAIQASIGAEQLALNGAEIHQQIRTITPQITSRLAHTDPLHICRLLELVAECSSVLGNFEDACYLYEYLLDLRSSERSQQQAFSAAQGNQEQRLKEAQIQALLWREIGNIWIATGDCGRAYQCYERGKEVMSRAGITSGAAWACLQLLYGAALRLEGNYHEARRYLQEALETLESVVQLSSSQQEGTPAQSHKDLQTRTERALLGDPLEIGDAHEKLGIVAASVGQLSEGIKHMHIALSIYEQRELVSEMARVCGNLGAASIVQGELDAARQYLQRSLDLAERTGDLPNMAHVMLNLGDASHRIGDLLESEKWYKHSLALAERINDRERMNGCLVELSSVQQDLGNLDEAAISLRRALSIGRALRNPRCIRYALISLGDLRIMSAIVSGKLLLDSVHQSQPPISSRRLLFRARSTLQRAISYEGLEAEAIIDGRLLLASLHFLLGDLETAEAMSEQILKESYENETLRTIGRAYRLLGRIMTTRGDYNQADYYFEQAMQIFQERGFRLEYARALHGYGISLAQRHTIPTPLKGRKTSDQDYRRGVDYLYEARHIFSSCHADLESTLIDHILTQLGEQSAAGVREI